MGFLVCARLRSVSPNLKTPHAVPFRVKIYFRDSMVAKCRALIRRAAGRGTWHPRVHGASGHGGDARRGLGLSGTRSGVETPEEGRRDTRRVFVLPRLTHGGRAAEARRASSGGSRRGANRVPEAFLIDVTSRREGKLAGSIGEVAGSASARTAGERRAWRRRRRCARRTA